MTKFLAYSLQLFILALGILSALIPIYSPNPRAAVSLTITGLVLVIVSSLCLGALQTSSLQLSSLKKQSPSRSGGEKAIEFRGEINPATAEMVKAMCELGNVGLKDLFNDGLVHLRWMTKEVVGGAEITSINSSRESVTGLNSPYLSNVENDAKCQNIYWLLHTSSLSVFPELAKLLRVSTTTISSSEQVAPFAKAAPKIF